MITSKKELPWLNLIRCIAALLVVIGHFRAEFFVNYDELATSQKSIPMMGLYVITSLGHVSVLIFFVLSGYLVGGGILNRIRNRNFSIRDYCIDRAVRIQLPLFAALILIACSNALCHIPVPIIDYLLNFVSLQGIFCPPLIGPLWSLSYEVWFYIFFGVAAYSVVSSNNRVVTFAVLSLSAIILSKLYVTYTLVWVLGAMASQFKRCRYSGMQTLISFVVMSVTALMHLNVVALRLGIRPLSIESSAITLIFAASSCVFILNIVHITPQTRTGIKLNAIGTKLAKFSYTLYLTHWSVLVIMLHFGVERASAWSLRSTCVYLIGILLSNLVAYILYLPFEAQSYRLKQWIRNRTR